jgi:hypothetical protein
MWKKGCEDGGGGGMRGRFGRGRIFAGRSAVWLGIGGLAIIALIARRHEKTSDAIRAAYSTVRERFGGPEQPARHDTDSLSEQAGEFLAHEEKNHKAETEGSPNEAEEGPSEEIEGFTRESAKRSEEGGGREGGTQGGEFAVGVQEGPSEAEGLPIDEYDSLTVTQITQRLGELSLEEVEQLRDYEAQNRNRRSIMQRFETRIRAARKNLKRRGDAESEESSGE